MFSFSTRFAHSERRLVFLINSLSSLHSCLPSSFFTLQLLFSLILSSSLFLSSPFPSFCSVLSVLFTVNISSSPSSAMASLYYFFLSLFISFLFSTSVFTSIPSFSVFHSSLPLRFSPSFLISLVFRRILFLLIVPSSLSYPFFFAHSQCSSSFFP